MDDPKVLTPAVASESVGEVSTVSSGQALLGVFASPRATFEGMRPKPHFKLAMGILVLAQVLLTVALFKSGAIQNDAVEKMEQEGRPDAQIQAMQEVFEAPATVAFGAGGGALTIVFFALFFSGLMYFMGNLMQGAKLTFSHYLSAAVHASLIGLVDQVVRAVLAFQKGTLHISLGLGLLLPEDMGPLGKVLDTATDPLFLWSTAVMALGVSVYARRGFGFGIVTIIPVFLVALALSAFR